ncbi:MAG: hypothetical protein Q4C66_08995 [Lachnospiraceae bacterium]|nr:hypothetical protein [Lachnospiraceae bacterium]
MESGNLMLICEMAARGKGELTIDLVNGDYRLQRLHAKIDAVTNGVEIQYQTAEIGVMDSKPQMLTIQSGTTVALVFDTDVPQTEILRKNVELLKRYCGRLRIIVMPQVGERTAVDSKSP